MECFLFIIEILDKVANIIIACLTLSLAYYVFIYQKNKDIKDKNLQWFKELIIQPKINCLFDFFEQILELNNDIKSNELNNDDKIALINKIKQKQAHLRKSFLELIQNISPQLYKELIDEIDKLTDNLTIVISNDEFKLCNTTTYEREVADKIRKTYGVVLKLLFDYKG